MAALGNGESAWPGPVLDWTGGILPMLALRGSASARGIGDGRQWAVDPPRRRGAR